MRKRYPAFGRGSSTLPATRRTGGCSPTCASTRATTILCVANLSRFAQYVELDLSRFAGRMPVELIGRVHFPPDRRAALPAHPGPARLPVVRADLAADASALVTPEWLTAQRWYGANDRHLAGLQLTRCGRAPDGGVRHSARGCWWSRPASRWDPRVRYLMPAVGDGSEPFREPRMARGLAGPRPRPSPMGQCSRRNPDRSRMRGGACGSGDLLPGRCAVDRRSWPSIACGVEQSNTSVQLRRGAAPQAAIDGSRPARTRSSSWRLPRVGGFATSRRALAGSIRYLGPGGAASDTPCCRSGSMRNFDAWRQLAGDARRRWTAGRRARSTPRARSDM